VYVWPWIEVLTLKASFEERAVELTRREAALADSTAAAAEAADAKIAAEYATAALGAAEAAKARLEATLNERVAVLEKSLAGRCRLNQ